MWLTQQPEVKEKRLRVLLSVVWEGDFLADQWATKKALVKTTQRNQFGLCQVVFAVKSQTLGACCVQRLGISLRLRLKKLRVGFVVEGANVVVGDGGSAAYQDNSKERGE